MTLLYTIPPLSQKITGTELTLKLIIGEHYQNRRIA